jgi:Fur family ferric uptake transcriptional regulator
MQKRVPVSDKVSMEELEERRIESIKEKFVNFLRENDLKVTDSRTEVLEAVIHSEDHFTADEFHRREFSEDNSVSRATVYRTLDVLEECGLIRKMVMRNGKAYYEKTIANTHHQHMICIECDKIMEFPGDALIAQLNVLCEGEQFEVFCHDIKVHGICEDCQEKKSNGSDEAPDSEE